ncbi:glycosyl hydrolase family 88 [Labilibaculum manganireducens]|uniref:Glycosyl hydrolase family 88 n=1 Tax=Labilibaculum manganireducens TaxID=1940525 RepID=A0A2N3I4U7_9BACT|nr:glycoside hydrolase family 88 protein [Labilibaculum manganireducens]PKQ65328.1 glycosyl hydrolase family 88 [Labilibaculum manganireducens]
MNRKILLIVIVGIGYSQCISCKRTIKSDVECKGLHMAVRMADSEMIHFPNSSTVDFNPKGKWGYTAGLVTKSMVELWKQTGEIKYYDYAKSYADQFINANGEIKGYKRSDFNIDNVNSGNFLFDLYQNTHDDRYKKAIFILRDQLNDHPRTTEGGFWHKKRYTHQMWLDGLYMGEPFYARFGSEFNEPEAFDDVINQFVVVHKHTYNSEVGLNYHGWDESKEQAWANPENGCSLHFWGRAMGWYAMALVDILDFIPENHPKREELIGIVKQVAAGIEEVQDPKTGLWYQVLDLGNKEGNYLESSCSCMFVYSLLKASRLNYIDKRYRLVAEKGYDGILKNFIKENVDETISITSVCSVAGLGGTPYRDGSYDYYIKEPVRDNDPKGIGPFILASIEMNN